MTSLFTFKVVNHKEKEFPDEGKFLRLFYSLPKLTRQFITKRIVYIARDDSDLSITVKIDKKQFIRLFPDGTWELIKH